MAVSEFTDFIRSVRSTYSDSVSDGILEDFVIFKEIQKATGRPKEYDGIIGGKGGFWTNVGGNSFQWRLMTGQMDFTTWGPGHNVTAVTPQLLTTAEDTMGGYRVAYFVDMFETLSMNTKEQYVPLLRLYEKMAARRWYTGFETAILKETTNGWNGFTKQFGTITGTPGTTSGTYAGIDLSQSYASPAIFNYSGSGQQFSLTCIDRLNTVVNSATHGDSQDGANCPDVAFMNRSDWVTMKSTIEDQHRLINVNTDMLKFGFKNFEYSGLRCYWSDEMTSQSINRVYILNMYHWGIAHAGSKLMVAESANSITGNVGLVNVSFHKGQVYCSNTKKQGVIANTNLQ